MQRSVGQDWRCQSPSVTPPPSQTSRLCSCVCHRTKKKKGGGGLIDVTLSIYSASNIACHWLCAMSHVTASINSTALLHCLTEVSVVHSSQCRCATVIRICMISSVQSVALLRVQGVLCDESRAILHHDSSFFKNSPQDSVELCTNPTGLGWLPRWRAPLLSDMPAPLLTLFSSAVIRDE